MLFSLVPAYGYQIGKDGSFSYQTSNINPYISGLRLADFYTDAWGSVPGDFVIVANSDYGSLLHYGCAYHGHDKPRTIDELRKNDFAIVRNMIDNNAGITVFGGEQCKNNYGRKVKGLYLQVISSETKPNEPGVRLSLLTQVVVDDIPTDPPEHEQCNSSLEGPMSFGVLDGSGSPTAETKIQVRCSKDSAISVKVNKGLAFQDPDSRAEISFVARGGSNNGSSIMLCQPDCSVRVTGEMKSTPSNPGAYHWSVPVIVEYK